MEHWSLSIKLCLHRSQKFLSSSFLTLRTVLRMWLLGFFWSAIFCPCNSHDLVYGVPQGSCLGPLVFTVYASKLFQVIRAHLPDVHAYTDDTQPYSSFQPNFEVEQQEAVQAMERCIASTGTWMELDKLKLNSDKTEIILVSSRPQLG